MLKRLLVMVFIVGIFSMYYSSGFLSAFANSEVVVDKSVITEYSTSTNDAIEKIRKKLEIKETVRVIVGLKNGILLPNEISSPQTIERLQNNFYNDISSVNNLSKDEIVNFDTMPYVSVFVTIETFEHLLQNSNVASIEEDIPARMTMAESHEIIGTNTTWDLGFTGKGQNVVILDTGVDKNHPFLEGKVIEEACYSTQNEFYDAQSLCPNKVAESHATGSGIHCSDIALGCDHGTHVAGTVAGKEVAVNGKILSGVAKEANLISIQVFTKLYDYRYDEYYIASYNTDQLKALEYIYSIKDKYNISSINMSLGGGQYNNYCTMDIRSTIFNNLTASGIAIVVASGNEGYNNSVSAPACIESAVTVGATTDSDTVTYFSNSANMVDLLAPGNTITSSVPGGSYDTWAGTSMATPHVAGAWAVLKEMKPNASVNEILTFLRNTGKPVKDFKNNIVKPRIDLKRIGEFTKIFTSIEVETNQNPFVLELGKTSLLKVFAKYTDGTSKDITNLANYEILDAQDKLVTGQFTFTKGYLKAITAAKGNYTINFFYNEKEISVDLTVVPVLEKIEANQSSFIMTTASPTQLAITAHYNDNSSEDVTQAATYTSSNAKLATVDETGKITVLDKTKTGSVVITVKYGTKTLSIPVTVEKVVTGVEIQENSLSVEIGKTSRYTVTVLYEDGSTKNITTLATAIIVDNEGNVVKGITASGGTLRALTTATKGNYT
ncbi:S8 family peptidase, partial [Psychrobacillus sp. NPDC096623]|uniref:S8 family peptidase n=1 Tax=Psychrobacillus sp. NPDC096623 TaxID=3364492 RepID=UPI0038274748